MTTNGEDTSLHQSFDDSGEGDLLVSDCGSYKTSIVDAKEQSDAFKLTVVSAHGEINPFLPRPPSLPRLSKSSKSGSLEKLVRTRRLRNSQESLSDPAETGSSTDSLKEDQRVPGKGEFAVSCSNTLVSQDSSVRPLSADRGSSFSDDDKRPCSQQGDTTDHRMMSTKVHLSPVQPIGPMPALKKTFVSATLRLANRIDKDCLDYTVLERENLGERKLSDSRLLENMGSDSASVNSLRSNYSVLSPIRPQDVRNRYGRNSRLSIRLDLNTGFSDSSLRAMEKSFKGIKSFNLNIKQ